MKYGRILLTSKLIFDVKDTLQMIQKKKKETEIKDIRYDLILTICKLWANNQYKDNKGNKKNKKNKKKKGNKKNIKQIADINDIEKMTNDILCLTEHYFKKQSGGGKDLIIY